MEIGEAIQKHPEMKERLTKIKKRKVQYEQLLALKGQPGVQLLTEELVAEVNAINTKLLSYDDLKEADRARLLGDKYRCVWLIEKFPDAERNLKLIQDYLDKL